MRGWELLGAALLHEKGCDLSALCGLSQQQPATNSCGASCGSDWCLRATAKIGMDRVVCKHVLQQARLSI